MSGFESIAAGLEDAIAHANGDTSRGQTHVPGDVDVRAIRAKLGLSQVEFAQAFGVSVAAIRNWEQQRRIPRGPARVLLHVIDREPEAVRRVLAAVGE